MSGNIGERHQNLEKSNKIHHSITNVLASSSLQENSKYQMQSREKKKYSSQQNKTHTHTHTLADRL